MQHSIRLPRTQLQVPRDLVSPPCAKRSTQVRAAASLLTVLLVASAARAQVAPASTPDVTVGSQYSTTHVYVAANDFDRLVSSLIATFGGAASKEESTTVTPTPSKTMWQAVSTPVGGMSVLGFITPIPYPFSSERTGYRVTNMDTAIRAARANGADIVVTPFPDPIGTDAILEWPGGVRMQLYWHTTPASDPKLRTEPENRVYVATEKADEFIRRFVRFSHGEIVADDPKAPGIEIGRPNDSYRRVRIESGFGKVTVLVTDGHLPYPYGYERTGYEVSNLPTTLDKAKAAGATVLVAPYTAGDRHEAIVQFPGGYIAEIHSSSGT